MSVFTSREPKKMPDQFSATDDATASGSFEVVIPEEFEPLPEASEPMFDLPAEEPATPRDEVAADAKQRAGRSAFQAALVAAFVAVLGVCATYLKDGDLSHLDWKMFAAAVAVAGGQPIAAYLHRMLG
jgi:hypothetical protein